MFRWTALCLFFCALTVGLVVGASYLLGQGPPVLGDPPVTPKGGGDHPVADQNNVPGPQAAPGVDNNRTGETSGKLQIQQIAANDSVTALQYTSLPGGRIQVIYKEEVPANKDGQIVFLATEAKPGEVVPEDKKLVAKCWMVGIRDKDVPLNEQVIVENPDRGAVYRVWKPTDSLPPGRLRVGYQMHTYRNLVEGDLVETGQLVAMIDTDLARDELSSRLAKIDVAESELQTSIATKDEAKSRYDRIVSANLKQPGTYSPEEEQGALLTWKRYFQEELAKRASLVSAQRDASGAISLLKKHEVRADIPGEIKVIYKHASEAVKSLDPVLQIQNPEFLRVETYLNVQDLSKVKLGMPVTVEPTMPSPPQSILSGHLGAVTCVAVSKSQTLPDGKTRFMIVSGSEDRYVIGWDSRTGHALWRLPHRSVIRALACTGEKAESNLALIGASDGSAQLIDLNDVAGKSEPLELEKRHQGAVLCVAFSVDGKTCATSGEDRTINLWNTEDGKLKGSIRAAHRASVTSLQFTPDNLLVSAGRDNDLNVWSVKPDEPPHRYVPGFAGRGGEVLQLGVSPNGKQVLFDQGKELLVLSLDKRKPEGVLQNFGVSGNFTHMALFAPNGKTILTASAAEGRLQLWRTPTSDGRAGELRQFIWDNLNTCGAFAPNSQFAVTGTQDHKVLIWEMPSEAEIQDRVTGTVSLVDPSLNSGSTHQVRVWVDVNNTDPMKRRRLIPGSIATIVLPPANP